MTLPATLTESPLFARLIAPRPLPTVVPPPRPTPSPPTPAAVRPLPAPMQLASRNEADSAPTVPEPPPPPTPSALPAAAPAIPAPPAAAGPVNLGTELALSCPDRPPPDYPAVSRRMGEQGRAMLRVELDARGQVTAAHIVTSSGSERLDNAALAAVRRWRCQAARRDGSAVPAVALQAFEFLLRPQ